jgi:threonine synthase
MSGHGSTHWQEQLERSRTDTWRYAALLGVDVPPERRVVMGEGWVPRRTLQGDGVLTSLVVQREDLNPNGSHKDRSLVVQVSAWAARGTRVMAISSSGNAAVAAAASARVAGVLLVAFVSPLTPPAKIAQITRWGALAVVSERAIGLCSELCADGVPNLRPSVDDLALLGYEALAFELAERGSDFDAVLCYTTSGSTLCGIARGFTRLRALGHGGPLPSLHAAQAGTIADIAAAFGHGPGVATAGRSLLRDLGVRRTRRKGELVRAIRASGGSAWHVGDEEVLRAREWLLDRGVAAGLESACTVACTFAAAREGAIRRPLVIVSGHYGHEAGEEAPNPQNLVRTDALDDVRAAIRTREVGA